MNKNPQPLATTGQASKTGITTSKVALIVAAALGATNAMAVDLTAVTAELAAAPTDIGTIGSYGLIAMATVAAIFWVRRVIR